MKSWESLTRDPEDDKKQSTFVKSNSIVKEFFSHLSPIGHKSPTTGSTVSNSANSNSNTISNKVQLDESTEFKYVCLISLVLINLVLVFSISLSRLPLPLSIPPQTQPNTPHTHTHTKLYLTSTAVAAAEVLKLFISLFLEYYTTTVTITNTTNRNNNNNNNTLSALLNINNLTHFWNRIKNELLHIDTLRVGIPGILYVIENNLLFVALSNLAVTIFEVTDQLKILTTALFSIVMLDMPLSTIQKISLFLLAAGVATVEMSGTASHQHSADNTHINSQDTSSDKLQIQVVSNDEDSELSQQEDQEDKPQLVLGLFCLVLSCVISGFAGVYFEKMVKHGRDVSIYVRNVQLAIYGVTFGVLTVYFSAESAVEKDGFFQNYTFLTWIVVSSQAIAGVVNALVIKYADNILKSFAASVSTILASALSAILLNQHLDSFFLIGCTTVVLSIYLYAVFPPRATLNYVR